MKAQLWFAASMIVWSAPSCAFDPSGSSSGRSGGDADAAGTADADPAEPPPRDADGASAPDAFACPPGYEIQGESYYRIGSDLSWADAEGACEGDGAGAHLVVIDDATENALVDALSSASRTWIGYSDRAEGDSWLWVTGGTGWTGGWDTGSSEPSGTGDCVATDGDALWGDEDCSDSRDYVCECDGRPADPASY